MENVWDKIFQIFEQSGNAQKRCARFSEWRNARVGKPEGYPLQCLVNVLSCKQLRLTDHFVSLQQRSLALRQTVYHTALLMLGYAFLQYLLWLRAFLLVILSKFIWNVSLDIMMRFLSAFTTSWEASTFLISSQSHGIYCVIVSHHHLCMPTFDGRRLSICGLHSCKRVALRGILKAGLLICWKHK